MPNHNLFYLLLLGLGLCTSDISAREIAGTQIPEQVQQSDPDHTLQLNGAGIRSKFIFDIYVAALYLEQPARSTEAVLAQSGANRVSMHFLYKEVSREKLIAAWDEGFANNNSGEQLESLRPRLEQFNTFFHTMKRGDTIQFDYTGAETTQVRINGEMKGSIAGADFNKALLKVWLGDKPADADLKQAMLQGE